MNKKVRKTVDLCMFLMFILLLITSSGIITVHELAGLLIASAIIIHLSLNMKWIKKSINNLLAGKLYGKTRLLFLLAVALFVSFMATIVFGVMQSQVLFPSDNISGAVHRLHTIFAIISAILMIFHIKMHWHSIKSFFHKKKLSSPR